MKNKKIYLIFMLIIVVTVVGFFFFNNSASVEEAKVKSIYPQAKTVQLIKDISDDLFLSLNFPGLKRAYKVDGQIKTFVSSCVGYNGPIDLLVAFDGDKDELLGVHILEHEETDRYAEYIEEDWFLSRFKNIMIKKYLNLVVLDKEEAEDIVQVTGATVSSQAMINAVNAAIGAYQYTKYNIEMEGVADVIPQEMWQKDINSFAINWEEGSFRIDTDKIKEFEQIEMDVILVNTTGTETKMKVKGPSLRQVLEEKGIDLSQYEGVGITGRDGYYTMVDKEKLETNEVILVWLVNGKELKDKEKPVRIAMPDELGPYWVKNVSNIDLYKEISPKDVDKLHIFEPLVADIEPYYYEYYGSKDRSIEVGKILNKFEHVDEKGFFTMGASDGLSKNETISLVRQRYFIKVEGENSPMNIAPNFKLGMNVKNMTHFSTTKDSVIFPEKMINVVRTKPIGNTEGLLLEDVLLTADMRWDGNNSFLAVSVDGTELEMSLEEMLNSYIIIDNNKVVLYGKEGELLTDLLRIEKE